MSLLNEALRNVEQRQHAPTTAAAYAGRSEAVSRRRRAPWVMLGVLGMVAASMAFGYWLSRPDSTIASVTPASSGEVVRPVAEEAEKPVVQQSSSLKAESNAVAVPEAVAPEEPEQPVEAAAPISSAEIGKTVVSDESSKPLLQNQTTDVPSKADLMAAEQPVPVDTSPAKPAQEKSDTSKTATAPMNPVALSDEPKAATQQQQPAMQPEQAPVTEVRTVHATPASQDRAAAVEIRDALSNGRVNDARQTLGNVVEIQSAPRSRAQWVRHLLVMGQIREALTWAPADIAADNADLRLLRARAQHALGDVDEAVATLQNQVPNVAANPDYAVTLATLLQQDGRYGQAATRWAELIAYDDSRSAWWVGLAIALESEQRAQSAARAYAQALELPDLSASLRDFVLQRLRALDVDGSNG